MVAEFTEDGDLMPASVEIPEDEYEHDAKVHFSFKKLWAFAGPGLLMSIAYLDPGNIESDLQAGAAAGFSLLWVLFWATCAGYVLQLLSVRLGVVTGNHLAHVCRDNYPKRTRIILWLMTELAIIGSDIQEVIGSATAIYMLSNGAIPLWGGVLITVADCFTFLFMEKYGIRKLEVLFALLIGIMAVTFGVEYGISSPDSLDVLKGVVVPNVPSGTLTQAVGMVGAVIMPHNIYLHSALVQSRKIDKSRKKHIKEANLYYAVESAIALLISFIINLFVVSVFAAAFFGVPDADNISLQNAGEQLGLKYGATARYIWAVGLLAAGQSSTMTGTYAGQFVMQGFLNLHMVPWKRVLLTRSISVVPALIVAVATTDVLDSLGEWLNVLQSVQLPFALIPVLTFTCSERIMGNFVNSRKVTALCSLLALLIIGTNLYQAYDQLSGIDNMYILAPAYAVSALYIIFLIWVAYVSIKFVTDTRAEPIFVKGERTSLIGAELCRDNINKYYASAPSC
eukprot:Colp12_sorted_trinity150504_noHs@33924